LESDTPEELEITFNKEPVKEVYRTLLLIFNKGNKAILKKDIVKPIKVVFGNSRILRKPSIISISKKDNDFSADIEKGTEDTIGINFLFLSKNDGALIEVMHSGKANVSCKGSIPDTNIRIIEGYNPAQPKPPNKYRGIVLSILVIGYMLALGIMSWLGISINSDLVAMFSYFIFVFAMIVISDIRKHIHYRKFPLWSNKVPINWKKLLLQDTEGQIEGYCVYCRSRKPMNNIEQLKMKNGSPAIAGICSDCGTKIYKIPRMN
jgi:hypothetical protein